jgi:hypothetical protein
LKICFFYSTKPFPIFFSQNLTPSPAAVELVSIVEKHFGRGFQIFSLINQILNRLSHAPKCFQCSEGIEQKRRRKKKKKETDKTFPPES